MNQGWGAQQQEWQRCGWCCVHQKPSAILGGGPRLGRFLFVSPSRRVLVTVRRDDLASFMFTSGTTGKPKVIPS